MKVVAYLRVSTAEQADSGLGLAAQRSTISREALQRGWDVVWLEDAGYTARNTRRPGLQEALRLLKKREADALVVAKLDRLSRSSVDFGRMLETAQRQRWAVVALDIGVDMTTPTGALVASILVSVAQWESRTIGSRTAEAMAEAKRRGARFGRERQTPPTVVARVLAERAAGRSGAEIAKLLDADAVPTPTGGAHWQASTVLRLIRSCELDSMAV